MSFGSEPPRLGSTASHWFEVRRIEDAAHCTQECSGSSRVADLVRRKGVKKRSCSPAYLATKRRAATPEVEKLQIRAAMKATPIRRSDLIMLTRLSH
jgi:hypothetical protein